MLLDINMFEFQHCSHFWCPDIMFDDSMGLIWSLKKDFAQLKIYLVMLL